jgi:hypothetical protein
MCHGVALLSAASPEADGAGVEEYIVVLDDYRELGLQESRVIGRAAVLFEQCAPACAWPYGHPWTRNAAASAECRIGVRAVPRPMVEALTDFVVIAVEVCHAVSVAAACSPLNVPLCTGLGPTTRAMPECGDSPRFHWRGAESVQKPSAPPRLAPRVSFVCVRARGSFARGAAAYGSVCFGWSGVRTNIRSDSGLLRHRILVRSPQRFRASLTRVCVPQH